MKTAVMVLFLLSLMAFAGQVAVDLDPIVRTDADWLKYDDGSAVWVTWGGVYRGVWFDMEDFTPGAIGASVEQAEFWFYHHSSYPWDTSDFYAELWNGTAPNVTTLLDQTTVTAAHYAPVYATYSTPIVAEANFWCFANTEMSSGGFPSILSDGAPIGHSFYGDTDMIMTAYSMGDYFVAVLVEPLTSLSRTTWGSMKALF